MQRGLLSSDKVISMPGLQRPSRSGERFKNPNQMSFFSSPPLSCITQKSLSFLFELFRLQGNKRLPKGTGKASALRAILPRTLQFLLLQARAAGLH